MGQEYEIVIGLEVHAELSTDSKIFCGCSTAFGAPPNTHVCPVCLGLPGSLPVLNQRVLQLALRAALALQCQIAEHTKFDRKNYFYPDLPKAYQISQYDLPLAAKGRIPIALPSGEKTIGITRVHLEEDAGKLVHLSQGGQIGTATSSVVDYNRAGIPLIEIVSEPDLRSADEAYAYLLALKEILLYTRVSDCNMEEGSLRCDANISVRPLGQQTLGTKVEIKNMNSFKNVRDALEYEALRQIRAVSAGEKISQETRLWDAERGTSHSMRSKEEAHDYRYFPEPDLPLIVITPAVKEEQENEIEKLELPREKRARFIKDYELSERDAGVLVSSEALADYFEDVVERAQQAKPKAICNWITGELLGKLNAQGKSIKDNPIQAGRLAELVDKIETNEISGKILKQLLAEVFDQAKNGDKNISWTITAQISDPTVISQLIEQALSANPGPVAEYKKGKVQTLGFLVGQVMKASEGKANPQLVNKILRERLAVQG